jgi:hypothetical protein
MRRTLLLLPLLFLGCEQPPPKLAGSGMDMFAPVKIRLHKLSRIVFPTTAPATAPSAPSAPYANFPILEVHLELSDQFGDAGKGIGDLTLQLFDAAPPMAAGKGPLLGTWNLSLNSPEENRDHWDRTTRTYLFRLPLLQSLPRDHDHVTLAATVTLPNGSRLTDELALPLK